MADITLTAEGGACTLTGAAVSLLLHRRLVAEEGDDIDINLGSPQPQQVKRLRAEPGNYQLGLALVDFTHRTADNTRVSVPTVAPAVTDWSEATDPTPVTAVTPATTTTYSKPPRREGN